MGLVQHLLRQQGTQNGVQVRAHFLEPFWAAFAGFSSEENGSHKPPLPPTDWDDFSKDVADAHDVWEDNWDAPEEVRFCCSIAS